jgi:membrane-associated phospholipid phosphatase
MDPFNLIVDAPYLRWAALIGAIGFVLWAARGDVNWVKLGRQGALVIAAYFAYFLVRGMTEGSVERAVDNAWRVVDFEKAVGLFHEERMQAWIVEHQWMVDLSNWIYIWGHWPVIATVALWLLIRHEPQFRLYRNAFLISGGIGLLIFATFPVAPPRLIDLDLVDTVTRHSESYRVLQPPALVNQYAAVPSLHFGWNLLIGIALWRNSRLWPTRVFAVTLPILMVFAIVLTGNHYIVDAIAGAAVALLGLLIAANWRRLRWKPALRRSYDPQPRGKTAMFPR